MAGRHSPRRARHPSHPTRAPATSLERLQVLGEDAPELPEEIVHAAAHERARRLLRRAPAVTAVVAVVVLATLQWLRPVPAPTFAPALAGVLKVPGHPPALAWPSGASAALGVPGGALLGRSGPQAPMPIAGVAKVMTAYVVLHDHPLGAGEGGPAVVVGPDAVAAYRAEAGSSESVVPVAAGEHLTELQALQGLLVGSGNDMAVLLADWDAGSTATFVSRMNDTARRLGLRHTTFADPDGLDPRSVSTPAELVGLGAAVLGVPALRSLVGSAEATLPLAGRVFNLDALVGHRGFVGIKTGSTSAAGGCYLFAAERAVAGTPVTLVGAVLGVHSATPTTSALHDAVGLVDSAFATAAPTALVVRGGVVGHVDAPWAGAVPVVTRDSLKTVGWPGEEEPLRVTLRRLPLRLPAGAAVDTVQLAGAAPRASSGLVLRSALPGPAPWWRLTRL